MMTPLDIIIVNFNSGSYFALMRGSGQEAKDTWGAYLILFKDYKNILNKIKKLKSVRGIE
jgi:hypothetical protein